MKRGHSPFRSGFTLLELLLVLALVVVLAAIAWPLMDRPLAAQRLRQGADRIRTEWTRARLQAMATGRTHYFRYAAGESSYAVEAEADPFEPLAAEAIEPPATALGSIDTATAEKSLPEGIVFAESQYTADASVEPVADPELAAAAMSPLGVAYSASVVFYPDGTATTTRLILQNTFDHQVELSLRGLTGVVNVGEPIAADSLALPAGASP